MIVTCQNCNARFNLKDSLVKAKGSKVRCSKCQTVFVVYPETPSMPAAPGKATEIKRESPPAGASGRAPAYDEGPDLSEIEKLLESSRGDGQAPDFDGGESGIDSGARKSPASAAGADEIPRGHDTGGGVLDLSEIEKMLDLDQDLDYGDRSSESEPDDLIFDLEEPMAEEEEAKESLGDFDLADIEKMIEQDVQENEAEAPAASEDLDLSDLDALLKTTPEAGAPEEAAPAPEGSGEQAAAELSFASDSSGDLDLSALEEMMETEAAEEPGSPAESMEEELKFELEEDTAPEGPETEDAPPVAADELDFSGLEELIKAEGVEPSPETAVEMASSPSSAAAEASGEEMSLDFELEEPDSPVAEEDSDEDFKISLDDEDGESAGGEAAEESPASDELSLEFDDEPLDRMPADEEAPDEAEAVLTSPGYEPDRSEDKEAEAALEEESEEESETVSEDQLPSGAPEAGRQRRLYTIVALVLILVLGGLGGGLLFMRQAGMQIPLFSERQKPQATDQGNLNISTIDIDGRFVENSTAGRLFVISGKARNGYKDARSFIQITGKLYAKGKKLVNTETVYCGNMISPIEVAKLPLETIKSRLGNKSGDNGANVDIKPGQERPFMIVFSNLPENLEEYTLEVARSEPAAGSAGGHP
jgi:predicted Zn finger-like uncharacterized protein